MILAMFSGGIDSIAMVHMLLQQGHKLCIHHIEIENEEHRSQAENVAVKKTLEYFTSVGLTNFEFGSSKLTCPTINGKFLFDTDTTNFFAGFICNSNPKIKAVAMGANKEDMARIMGTPRVDRGKNIFQLFTNAEKIYPIKDYGKKELYDMLPQELKDVFWSCRTPVYKDNYAKLCNQCYTCGQMKRMGIVQKDLLLD